MRPLLCGSIRGQKPNQVNHAPDRQQTDNGRGECECRVQGADRRCGFGGGGGFGRGRSGSLGHGRGAGPWGRRRGRGRSRRRRWRGRWSGRRSCRAAGRQSREFDCRRRRRFRWQIDTDGFFLGLDLAGFLLGRNGATRGVGNVLCHKFYVVKISCRPVVSNSYSEKQTRVKKKPNPRKNAVSSALRTTSGFFFDEFAPGAAEKLFDEICRINAAPEIWVL